jgi:hypothetical protein
MQRARTARADSALHIDHRLDAWQMHRQLAPVGPTSGGAHFAFGRIVLLARGLIRCRCLLSILQRKLELVLQQALRPPAEAMTLELANDLAQPLTLELFGDQHRLEQAGVIRQGIGLRAHQRSGSQTLTACDRFAPAGSPPA